jgi:hypothetical protein
LGGANFDHSVQLAQKGVDFLFPKDSEEGAFVREWFNRTGLGNHKAFIRAMSRIGKARSEDVPLSGKVAEGKTERTLPELLYGKAKAS